MSVSKTDIAGTRGTEPVGVVLSCGIKDGRGVPIEKDRYHLVVPREADGKRAHHDAFAAFNGAPSDKRHMVRGNIVHGTKAQCYEGYLRNQVPPKSMGGAHPNKKPFCQGDGVHAVRWMGDGPDDFADIKCPNERCEFRLTEPPSCKPFTRLLFQIRWPEGNPLPRMLCKFTSGGWYTYSNIKGFFDYIEQVARQLGLEQYTLFGYPFTLSLQQQTKPSARSRFPVTVITPDMDPVEFFGRQAQQLEQLRAVKYEAITDQSQQSPELEYSDVHGLQKGTPK